MTPQPTIAPTTPLQVLTAAVVGGGVSWIAASAFLRQGSLPPVGVVAWVSPLLLAVGLGVLAWRTRAKVRTRRPEVDAVTARNLVLLGKTGVLAGTVLAAGWGVLAAVSAQGWPAPLAVERVLNSGGAAGASILLAVAAWFLERACRISDTPEGKEERDMPPDALRDRGNGQVS